VRESEGTDPVAYKELVLRLPEGRKRTLSHYRQIRGDNRTEIGNKGLNPVHGTVSTPPKRKGGVVFLQERSLAYCWEGRCGKKASSLSRRKASLKKNTVH